MPTFVMHASLVAIGCQPGDVRFVQKSADHGTVAEEEVNNRA